MCAIDPYSRGITPQARPVPKRYSYAVALRQEGAPGNINLVTQEGTSMTVDAHWVRINEDRDTVALFPASLVRRVTRIDLTTPRQEMHEADRQARDEGYPGEQR